MTARGVMVLRTRLNRRCDTDSPRFAARSRRLGTTLSRHFLFTAILLLAAQRLFDFIHGIGGSD
jgi:hypothetical protein